MTNYTINRIETETLNSQEVRHWFLVEGLSEEQVEDFGGEVVGVWNGQVIEAEGGEQCDCEPLLSRLLKEAANCA